MPALWVLPGVLCLLLLGCSREQLIEKLSWPEDRALAEASIRDLARGDAAALAGKMPPQAAAVLNNVLPRMRAALPAADDLVIEAVEARYMERLGGGPPVRHSSLTYEISGGGRFAVAQIEILREGGSAVLTSFRIMPLQEPASSLHSFTLFDKGVGQWLFLLFPLAALGVSVAALVRVWRSGKFRRRWLWTLGCAVGVTRFAMDWSSGEVFFAPLSVQLLSAGAFKPALLAPWVVSFSLPLVAIWALARAREPSSEVTATFH